MWWIGITWETRCWYEKNIEITYTGVGCLDMDCVLIGLGED